MFLKNIEFLDLFFLLAGKDTVSVARQENQYHSDSLVYLQHKEFIGSLAKLRIYPPHFTVLIVF
jgi:hypothetical protein